MKVPFTSSQNQPSTNQKQVNGNGTVRNPTLQGSANPTNLCYEPKSVLDVRRSPSPNAGKPASKTEFSDVSDVGLSQYSEDPLHFDAHGLNHFEDWDSLMRELELHDDSTPGSKSISQFPHCDSVLPELLPSHSFEMTQFVPSDFNSLDLSNDPNLVNHWNAAFDFVDELIRLAECFETNSVQLAHVILARLNQRLRSAVGKPLQRAAFYIKEAIQSLLTGSNRMTRPSTSSEIIQLIKAYKTFSNISPIPLFSNFTANQAILEAVDGSMLVHVIDFDINLGVHWASFMKEIADKAEFRNTNPPVLRITAVVSEEYGVESRLIRENLSQFARELKIGFEIEFVLIRTFEFLSFKAIKFMEGEKIAVLLSPTIFRRIGAGFVNDLRGISPHVVVHVDSEGLIGGGTLSFRQVVIDGLEFYSTVLESLDATNGGGATDWIRKIETFVLIPKIFAAVETAGRRVPPWREVFTGAGMRPVGSSQFADFQAECLLRRVQVRGFHLVKRQAELVLCWHERALVAMSAWRC